METTFETLEARKLLSVSLTEAEPNNLRTRANVVEHALGDHVLISGQVNTFGDRDWFKIEVNQGDVVGAALTGQAGLDTVLRLVNSAGKLMMGNDDHGTGLTAESPFWLARAMTANDAPRR